MRLRCLLALSVTCWLAGGCCEQAPAPAPGSIDLRNVELSADLRPSLEASRRQLSAPDRDTPAARDVERANDLILRIQRIESRQEAGDELYRRWEEEPAHFLWIATAIRYDYLLRREEALRRMLARPVLADTAGPVGAFAQGYDNYGYGSRGEHYLRSWRRRAELDSLQQVILAMRVAVVESDRGDGLKAARLLLDVTDRARAVAGSRLELQLWYYITRFLIQEDRLDDALHASALAIDLARKAGGEYWLTRCRTLLATTLEARREYEAALETYEECARISARQDLPWLRAESLDLAASLCSDLGRLERALAFNQRNLAHGLAVGDSLSVPRNMMNIAYNFRLMGELDSCLAYQKRAERWVDAFGKL